MKRSDIQRSDILRSSIFRAFITTIIIAAVLSGCSKKENPVYTIEPPAISSVTPSESAVKTPEPTLTQSPTEMSYTPATLLDAAIAQTPILDNGATIEDIARFLNQSEGTLLEQYKAHIKCTREADPYEDNPYDEYYYKDLGITLVCHTKNYDTDGVVKYIELDKDRIEWAGIGASMNFKQVTDILGEAEVHTLEDGLPGLKTYELRYQYTNIKLRIYSWDKKGNDGIYISIVDDFIPEYRPIRITLEQIGHYFDLSFEELKKEVGENDIYNKYSGSVSIEYLKYRAEFLYDEQQNQLFSINLDARYQIDGLKNGISLEDAMKVMGKTKVNIELSEENGTSYFIQYKFRNFILRVWSSEDDGGQAYWSMLGNEFIGQDD